MIDLIYAIAAGIIIGVSITFVIIRFIDRRHPPKNIIIISENTEWNIPTKWCQSQNEIEVIGGGGTGDSRNPI